jgi:PKD repeat protein
MVSNFTRSRFKLRSLAAAALVILANSAFAGQANLAWDANTDPAVAGYMVYYGQVSGGYTSKVDVGNTTNKSISGLLDGKTYYYAVTAYDINRVESDYSNEASGAVAVAYAAPAANFNTSATSGTAPLSIAFTSTSTGTITGYSWNFGDGTSSTAANPSHSYAAAGTYSVSLTVTGPGGSSTQTKANLITVSAPTKPGKGRWK